MYIGAISSHQISPQRIFLFSRLAKNKTKRPKIPHKVPRQGQYVIGLGHIIENPTLKSLLASSCPGLLIIVVSSQAQETINNNYISPLW